MTNPVWRNPFGKSNQATLIAESTPMTGFDFDCAHVSNGSATAVPQSVKKRSRLLTYLPPQLRRSKPAHTSSKEPLEVGRTRLPETRARTNLEFGRILGELGSLGPNCMSARKFA